MTEIVEEARKIFNQGQRSSRSIAKTFKSAGQDPWDHSEDEFKAHLYKLAELPVYALMQRGIKNCTGASLPLDPSVSPPGEEEAEIALEPAPADAEEVAAGDMEVLAVQGVI